MDFMECPSNPAGIAAGFIGLIPVPVFLFQEMSFRHFIMSSSIRCIEQELPRQPLSFCRNRPPRGASPDARRGRFVDVLLLTNETRWQETVGASLHDTARPRRLPPG